jgi:hypothetical protein
VASHWCTMGKEFVGVGKYMFVIKGIIDGNQH